MAHQCEKEGMLGSIEAQLKSHEKRMDSHGTNLREAIDNEQEWHNNIIKLQEQVSNLIKTVGSIFSFRAALIGVVFTIILQICGFFYFWGQLQSTVENHSKDLKILNELHPRVSADYKKVGYDYEY